MIEISWNAAQEIDATIVEGDYYLGISQASGAGALTVMATVAGGHTYQIRVNSYYGEQPFNLKAVLY